jgi:hypothetical protein
MASTGHLITLLGIFFFFFNVTWFTHRA